MEATVPGQKDIAFDSTNSCFQGLMHFINNVNLDDIATWPVGWSSNTINNYNAHAFEVDYSSPATGDSIKHEHYIAEGKDLRKLSEQQNARAPRTRKDRCKNLSPLGLQQRREQNRASQRAYRARKMKRIEELEKALKQSEARYEILRREFLSLYAKYKRLEGSILCTGCPQKIDARGSNIGWSRKSTHYSGSAAQ
ncbi:hypothetical protein BX600DRAFT_444082 [Xylariales sp. PMI_506]|nr:hypothetical protein BX600DRAFT_444082 [Xylariales sp. PMI_506]